MGSDTITISSLLIVNIYKYFLLPFYVLLSLAVSALYFIDGSPKSFINIMLYSILFLTSLIVIYLITRLKVITANEKELFFDDINIPWNIVSKIYFPFISPLLIIIIFKRNAKNEFILSMISLFKYEMVKNWVREKKYLS